MKGEHPLYNGKNGTPLVKLDSGKTGRFYQIDSGNTASIFRKGSEFNNKIMVKGIAWDVCLKVGILQKIRNQGKIKLG
jgi:hypothetical protein